MLNKSQCIELLNQGAILLYDGECGVCSASVQWILRHEKYRKTLQFASLQSELGKELREMTNISDDIDSLIWIELKNDHVSAYIWSGAVLKTINYIGGIWKVFTLMVMIPPFIRNFCYRLFAKHRKKVFVDQCYLPTQETKERFVGL